VNPAAASPRRIWRSLILCNVLSNTNGIKQLFPDYHGHIGAIAEIQTHAPLAEGNLEKYGF